MVYSHFRPRRLLRRVECSTVIGAYALSSQNTEKRKAGQKCQIRPMNLRQALLSTSVPAFHLQQWIP